MRSSLKRCVISGFGSSFRELSVFNSIGALTVSNGKNSWWW